MCGWGRGADGGAHRDAEFSHCTPTETGNLGAGLGGSSGNSGARRDPGEWP